MSLTESVLLRATLVLGLSLSGAALLWGFFGPPDDAPQAPRPLVAPTGTGDCLGSPKYTAQTEVLFGPDTSAAATWRTKLVTCPDVVTGTDGSRRMYFKYQDATGDSGIGMAIRQGSTWEVQPEPVLRPSDLAGQGAEQLGCTTTLVEGSLERHWFRANLPGKQRVIFAATSHGGHWEVEPGGPVLEATEDWMRGSLWEPSVLRDTNTYRMYMRCGSHVKSTLCMATSPDGDEWTMHPQPVAMHPRPGKGALYDSPQVIRHGDQYYLWYTRKWFPDLKSGSSPAEDEPSQSEIGLAVSADPAWFDLEATPDAILEAGAADWMAGVVDHPFVDVEDGHPVLYFRGAASDAGEEGSIGRAAAGCTATTGLPSRFFDFQRRQLGPQR